MSANVDLFPASWTVPSCPICTLSFHEDKTVVLRINNEWRESVQIFLLGCSAPLLLSELTKVCAELETFINTGNLSLAEKAPAGVSEQDPLLPATGTSEDCPF